MVANVGCFNFWTCSIQVTADRHMYWWKIEMDVKCKNQAID